MLLALPLPQPLTATLQLRTWLVGLSPHLYLLPCHPACKQVPLEQVQL